MGDAISVKVLEKDSNGDLVARPYLEPWCEVCMDPRAQTQRRPFDEDDDGVPVWLQICNKCAVELGITVETSAGLIPSGRSGRLRWWHVRTRYAVSMIGAGLLAGITFGPASAPFLLAMIAAAWCSIRTPEKPCTPAPADPEIWKRPLTAHERGDHTDCSAAACRPYAFWCRKCNYKVEWHENKTSLHDCPEEPHVACPLTGRMAPPWHGWACNCPRPAPEPKMTPCLGCQNWVAEGHRCETAEENIICPEPAHHKLAPLPAMIGRLVCPNPRAHAAGRLLDRHFPPPFNPGGWY